MVNLKVKKLNNLEKIVGLIGKDKPYVVLIKTHFGIHTFGLKFPIDVLILNKNNKVVRVRKNLKPNRIFFWNPIYDQVIELPQGTIENKNVKINDCIDLKY